MDTTYKTSARTAALKAVARKILPSGIRTVVSEAKHEFTQLRTAVRLGRLRHRLSSPSSQTKIERLGPYTVCINDGPNFYSQYKDIFEGRIYHFDSSRPDPLILDCGSNIGGAILYYKHIYPKARVIGFEPDPTIFPYLQENVSRNGLQDVQLVQAALAAKEMTLTFYSDGRSGSYLAGTRSADPSSQHWTKYDVPCIRLRNFLNEPVDFLKMNIEGAEWEVLEDIEDVLRNIEAMVIEYHHLPGLPRTLHKILALLDRKGFEYLINHFDYENNPGLRPPFHLTPRSRYYLLIYGKRVT